MVGFLIGKRLAVYAEYMIVDCADQYLCGLLIQDGRFKATDCCWVATYAAPYVGTVPDIPNTHKMSTNIGHRFVHQSGLDETSGRNSTTFRHRKIMLHSRVGLIVIFVNFNSNTSLQIKLNRFCKHSFSEEN